MRGLWAQTGDPASERPICIVILDDPAASLEAGASVAQEVPTIHDDQVGVWVQVRRSAAPE